MRNNVDEMQEGRCKVDGQTEKEKETKKREREVENRRATEIYRPARNLIKTPSQNRCRTTAGGHQGTVCSTRSLARVCTTRGAGPTRLGFEQFGASDDTACHPRVKTHVFSAVLAWNPVLSTEIHACQSIARGSSNFLMLFITS